MYSYRPNANDGNRYAPQEASAGSMLTHGGVPFASPAEAQYYSLHHLTALPSSITKFADRAFSTVAIERALHSKMAQYSTRDSDRFRQLLRWIKNRQSAAPAGTMVLTDLDDSTGQVSVIRREQFQNVLEIMGVFATQEQADRLFDKYDTQRRGYLSLHELMCRASSALESDHSGPTTSELASGRADGARSDEMFASKGKRQFLRLKLTGEGERPITPRQATNQITVPAITRALREKLRVNSKVGDTGSIPRSRRELARVFEYYDPHQTGSLTPEQLVRALHSVNFPLGEQHLNLLLESFPSATPPPLVGYSQPVPGSQLNGLGMLAPQPSASIFAIKTDAAGRPLLDQSSGRQGFDYVSYVLYCFPDSQGHTSANPLSTSLFLNHQLGREFFASMSVEERRKRGLPPTHEQFEAMDREAAESRRSGTGGPSLQRTEHGEILSFEEQKDQQQSHQQQPQSSLQSESRVAASTGRVRPPESQFSRERAPPTPMLPLSPQQHYLNIAGRPPPPSWAQSLQRNPYLQTVLLKGAGRPGFPFTQTTADQAATATANGSQSARQHSSGGPRESSFAPTSPRTPNSVSIGGRSIRSSQGQRPATGAQGGRGGAAGAGANSNALNPFASSSTAGPSFIPHAAFNGQQQPQPQAQYGAGAEAFANILAAPSPERRPQTGITTYVRGGAGGNRPLPPVTPRTAARAQQY